jgi:hypothetical protein
MRDHRREDDLAGGPDPSLFFRPLAAQDPPEEFWAGFWPSIRAGIREARIRRPDFLTRGRALFLGSSAGVMAAAAVLVVAFLIAPALRAPGPSEPVPVSSGAAPGPARAATTVPSAPTPAAGETFPPPVMEDLQSASARVYTFRVGEPADSTDVILIVDESLDI